MTHSDEVSPGRPGGPDGAERLEARPSLPVAIEDEAFEERRGEEQDGEQ
jgi:hypothetical protein